MYDDRWFCDFKTHDIDAFFRFCWTRKGCMLFIDEAGGFGKYSEPLTKLMTKGRHLGHCIFLMTQDLTQVSPLIREQCSKIYLFASSDRAFKIIADAFRKPDLLTRPALGRGEFYEVSRFSEISKFSIDFKSGMVYKNLCNTRLNDNRSNGGSNPCPSTASSTKPEIPRVHLTETPTPSSVPARPSTTPTASMTKKGNSPASKAGISMSKP